jgi:HTH-type transcriptional regulator/antitoxin HigA
MMEAKGWSPEELATITGKHPNTIYAILSGKTTVSLEMAVALGAAFGNPPEEWLKWDNLHQLSTAEVDGAEIKKRARFYEIAPIRDMQKRGWIDTTNNPSELEASLKQFFGSESLDEDLSFPIAPRRAVTLRPLNFAEKAWCFRARHLAKALTVPAFSPRKLSTTERKLRQFAAFPKEARHVPKALSECGIRFIVIEPIPGAKIDGAAFWIETQPVIAVSLRYDRIDGFWFTLMHEFAHIVYGDASVDADLVDGTKGISVALIEDETEKLANKYAEGSLIPQGEMQSFIRRVGPLYPKDRIIQFAHKVKVHPGIIVGQLQYRNEIGYTALREWLVKIRDIVISTALTDGWGQSISPVVV